MLLSSAHGPNGPWQPEDFDLVEAGGFDAVKLMASDHRREDIPFLRRKGVRHFTLRLRNSLWEEIRTDPQGNPYKESRFPSADDYARAALDDILRFSPEAPDLWVQLDCEANWQWTRLGYGPQNYAFWLRRTVAILREALTDHDLPNVKLISPPLSYSPALWNRDAPGTPPEERVNPTDFVLNDWLAVYEGLDEGGKKVANSLYSLFDIAGCNCYWQSVRQMYLDNFGSVFAQLLHRAEGMPISILEYGCDLPPEATPQDRETARRLTYPLFLLWAESCSPLILEAAGYLVGGTPDWEYFRMTTAVAAAIRVRRHQGGHHNQHGGPIPL